MKIKVFFAWYDFWIGWFWDRNAKVLYICLVPMVVIRLGEPKRSDAMAHLFLGNAESRLARMNELVSEMYGQILAARKEIG